VGKRGSYGPRTSKEDIQRAVLKILTRESSARSEAARLGVSESTVNKWLQKHAGQPPVAGGGPPKASDAAERRALEGAGIEVGKGGAEGDGREVPAVLPAMTAEEVVAFVEGILSGSVHVTCFLYKVPLGTEVRRLSSLTDDERASLMPGAREVARTGLLDRWLHGAEKAAVIALVLPACGIFLRRFVEIKALSPPPVPRAKADRRPVGVGFHGGPPETRETVPFTSPAV